MKITVDIDDFWLGEDENLSVELEKHVTATVVSEIWKKVKDKVDKQISIKVGEVVRLKMTDEIDKRLSEIVKTGHVKNLNSPEMVTMEEYIKNVFDHGFNYNNLRDHVTNIAKRLSKDIRDRADLLFASQIVIKLNEQGLLKEDAAKTLLKED